ncbi:tetratricopeptide repeat protein [Wenzhouxiangella marina]|uniref:Uncharacterized protein n=1 Tax=Wenzhouxiangella marina TaxID=1579979 RepID=A0A0K0XZA3_9GAMM|nr:tetratricopeptide repeat protein [Wenzhouxiangella marina]AKS42962.1 hypothetical protein WM2015_2604 [Wenzhouxiangella marina]MBB6087354.1 tetratricopeptide (TPR) repeat protein [Wenzhouxiangella marina]
MTGFLRGAAALLFVFSTLVQAQLVQPELPDLGELPEPVREAVEQARENVRLTEQANAPAPLLAQAWGQYGEALQAHGLTAPARQAYLNAHELAPGFLDWPYLLGTLDISDGRLEPALDWFGLVLASDGTDVPALIRRGQTYLELDRPEPAIRDFERVLQLNPESAAGLAGLGRAALAQGRFAEAVDYLQQALGRAPSASALYQPLGMALRGQGDTERARAALAQAGEITPAFPDPLIERVRSRSRSPQFYLELALGQAEAGNLAGAQSLLASALSLAPDDPLIIENYGDVSARLGALVEARDAFAALVELQPRNASARFRLAQVDELMGRLDEAEQGYRRVLAIDEGFDEAREAMAFVELARRRFDAAAAAFERMADAASGPDAQRLRYWQAMARLGAGDCAEGAALLERLRQLEDGFDPEVLGALARVRASCLGAGEAQLSEAFNWAEVIYQDAPGMETAATLAMVYAAMGLFDDAVDLQAQALFEALKLGILDARPDLQEDMARYREGQRATRPFAPAHPVYGADAGQG